MEFNPSVFWGTEPGERRLQRNKKRGCGGDKGRGRFWEE